MNRKIALIGMLLACTPAFAQEKAPAKVKSLTESLKGYGLTFYGHLRLDVAFDTARTNSGATASYVNNYTAGNRDDELNMTARHTRFGLNFNGGEFGFVKKAKGKLEIDFYDKSGGYSNSYIKETQHGLRLRHAYMDFELTNGWSVLAGQTWDLCGAQQMKKLNTAIGWNQGNIAYRRSQLRVTKKIDKTSLALAFARPLAKTATGNDYGEDAAVPDVQARIGQKFSFGEIALGGFYGTREQDSASPKHYHPYGVILEFNVPVNKEITVFGEIFTGEAMGAYNACIGHELSGGDEVKSRGGFVNLTWKPCKKWMYVFGVGTDDPDGDDMSSGRVANTTVFANARYTFYKGAIVALELDRMDTDWVGNKDRINYRTQLSVMWKF